MEIRNGKKPLAAKAASKPMPITMEDIFGNTLGLDPSIIKALKAKGLAYRFVSAAKLQQNAGYHERGWTPIKRKDIEGYGTLDTFGADPEGYVRRGDLVLAVRPQALNDKHKAYIAQEANRGNHSQKSQAKELREFVKNSGAEGITVIEGYDEKDE
jgi:hypothetical protein